MTADYVAFHAQQRPQAVALLGDGRSITYADFARDIRKFTRALREFGIPLGGTVAVECGDTYVHWLLLLACERLGIATTSLVAQEEASVLPLLDGVDLLLSEQPFPAARPKRRHSVSEAWTESVLGLPDGEEPILPQIPEEATLRILRTSGTTGLFKRIAITRRMHRVRIDHWLWCYGLSAASRSMVSMPFVIGGVYSFACASLRAGGTVVSETRSGIAAVLAAHGVTNLVLLPIFLRTLLDRLPADFERLPGLVVSTFGGAIARDLRERAVARLCGAVCDMYGSNEVGFIGLNGLNRVGPFLDVWPGVAVEIVDERDRPLPPGQTGSIRVCTETMFQGYLDDPATTRQMLREGWFHPGDLGVLRGPGELELLGRADDLLNIGGIKFLPERVEEVLTSLTPLREVAVGAIPNAQGVAELWVAVAEPDRAEAELRREVARALAQVGFQRFVLVRLAQIPRNAAGRVQRHLLREAMLAALPIWAGTGAG